MATGGGCHPVSWRGVGTGCHTCRPRALHLSPVAHVDVDDDCSVATTAIGAIPGNRPGRTHCHAQP